MVGLGPGQRDLITPRALASLHQAEVIIGYKTYIALIKDLISDKQVISSGMRKETERARLAVDMAKQGKLVAVVSSGDPGVYGMAGIILEVAGDSVPVEIIPGVTAGTAAAALLGAPIMHDFTVISLSDLLTPWEKIVNRLHAAGQGDFVVIIYNPRSQGRQQQIEAARQILIEYRSPHTPVGIVRNAGRVDCQVVITDLENLLKEEIDMVSTVIIGNSETRLENGCMVTPRGYAL
nr:precorrin-3B C(17)-methyltransferase [Syntrophomonas zehnderi]